MQPRGVAGGHGFRKQRYKSSKIKSITVATNPPASSQLLDENILLRILDPIIYSPLRPCGLNSILKYLFSDTVVAIAVIATVVFGGMLVFCYGSAAKSECSEGNSFLLL